jgi:hypothetical protein
MGLAEALDGDEDLLLEMGTGDAVEDDIVFCRRRVCRCEGGSELCCVEGHASVKEGGEGGGASESSTRLVV